MPAVTDSILATNITLTVPLGAMFVSIIHESYQQESQTWVMNTQSSPVVYPMMVDLDVNLQQVTTSSYNWQPLSCGNYTIQWYDTSSKLLPQYNLYYNIYEPYVYDTDFFNDFSQFSSRSSQFNYFERKVRRIIASFCEQDFQPWINKCVKVTGQGGNSLTLDKPILNLTQVVDMFAYDQTLYCQADPASEYTIVKAYTDMSYLQEEADGFLYDIDVKHGVFEFEQHFTNNVDYYITGDFGAYYVPGDITEAAKLLIADEYSGVGDMRNHGIGQAQLGDYSYTIETIEDGTATTGNIQADLLLQEYTNSLNMRLI